MVPVFSPCLGYPIAAQVIQTNHYVLVKICLPLLIPHTHTYTYTHTNTLTCTNTHTNTQRERERERERERWLSLNEVDGSQFAYSAQRLRLSLIKLVLLLTLVSDILGEWLFIIHVVCKRQFGLINKFYLLSQAYDKPFCVEGVILLHIYIYIKYIILKSTEGYMSF